MNPTQAPTLATQSPKKELKDLLKSPSYADRFREVLGQRAPQFVSSLLSVARGMEDVDAKSIIGSAMIAASLDLPIEKNLGFAWIVPYRDGGTKYAQFQIGWKGLVQLAWRSGQYKTFAPPRLVNAEAFKGYDSIGLPIIDWNLIDEEKPPIGVVFAWRLVNGGETCFFWTMDKIKAHAQRYSQSYRSGKGSPWQTHFIEMAKKTLVKNSLAQFGALSVQMQTAFAHDQAIVKDAGAAPEYPDNDGEASAIDVPTLENKSPSAIETGAITAQTGTATAAATPAASTGAPPPAKESPKRGRPKKEPAPANPVTAAPAPQPAAAPASDSAPAGEMFDEPEHPLGRLTDSQKKLCQMAEEAGIEVGALIDFCNRQGLFTNAENKSVEITDLREAPPEGLAVIMSRFGWDSIKGQFNLMKK